MVTAGSEANGRVAATDEIRRAFPALARTHNGHPVAYFDGPGGTQVPRVVAEAVADYLLHHNANTHWNFPTSRETDVLLLMARQSVGDFLGASPGEIAFGPNMTSLTFHLSRTLGRQWGPDDAIVVTELDHHANVDPWRALERERGVNILRVRMIPETGELDWDHLVECLADHHVRLLAIGAASNALGTINDVPRATAMAREAGALSFVDAVHFAPHSLVNVRKLGCDFLGCSAYKFYGPHLGILFGRREVMETLEPPKLEPAPDSAPERMETGTQNHEGIVGAAAAVEFLASLGGSEAMSRRDRLELVFEELHRRSAQLLYRLWSGLEGIAGVKLYGPPYDARRTPTVSFTLEQCPSDELSQRLADAGIFASHGNFYAQTAVRRLGVGPAGLLRLGCAVYTTEAEVDRVIEAVQIVAGR